jgi:hypothetical protein
MIKRKPLAVRIQKAVGKYVSDTIALASKPSKKGADAPLHELQKTLRSFRLRERDIHYHVRDAQAQIERAFLKDEE